MAKGCRTEVYYQPWNGSSYDAEQFITLIGVNGQSESKNLIETEYTGNKSGDDGNRIILRSIVEGGGTRFNYKELKGYLL